MNQHESQPRHPQSDTYLDKFGDAEPHRGRHSDNYGTITNPQGCPLRQSTYKSYYQSCYQVQKTTASAVDLPFDSLAFSSLKCEREGGLARMKRHGYHVIIFYTMSALLEFIDLLAELLN